MSWYRRFQRLPNVPRQRYTDEIILFADSAGALKTVDEDGVVAAVGGGGGSQPDGETPLTAIRYADCKYALFSDWLGQVTQTDSYSYADGTAGVGSTMTASGDGELSVDGATPEVGDRIMVVDNYNGLTGIFEVTAVGAVDAPWVLTRTSDNDTPETYYRFWFVRITDGDKFALGLFHVTLAPVPPGGNLYGVYGALSALGAIADGNGAVAMHEGSLAHGRGTTAVLLGDHAYGIDSIASGGNAGAIGDQAMAIAGGAMAVGKATVNDLESTTRVDAQDGGVVGGDQTGGARVVVISPDATKWEITVGNDGALTTTELAP